MPRGGKLAPHKNGFRGNCQVRFSRMRKPMSNLPKKGWRQELERNLCRVAVKCPFSLTPR